MVALLWDGVGFGATRLALKYEIEESAYARCRRRLEERARKPQLISKCVRSPCGTRQHPINVLIWFSRVKMATELHTLLEDLALTSRRWFEVPSEVG